MKRILIVITSALFIYSACTVNPRDKEVKQISDLKQKMINDTTLVMNRQVAFQMIEYYNNFIKTFPEDELCAEYLYDAAELSMNLNLGSQAIQYFEQLINDHQDYPKIAEAYFMEAFIYENQLGNEKKAKELYSFFMEKYPNHVLYKDAKASIKHMGKPLDEIIREFESKNKAKEAVIMNQ